jgi:serine/threonine-protein kinase
MATVWRARHRSTPVAIKLLRLSSIDARRAFAHEVQIQARMQHPHIVRVLDAGESDAPLPGGLPAGTPWIATELIEGADLSRRRLPPGAALLVLEVLLEALAEAHSHGIVHLDVKPGNVLLGTGPGGRTGIRLADFGIARLQGLDARDEVVGTSTSMAPEQCIGASGTFGPWTDLYALGCLAHRWLCGTWPHRRLRGLAAIHAHVKKAVPTPVLAEGLPDRLADWLLRLLERPIADRYRSAAAALRDLRAIARPPTRMPELLDDQVEMVARRARSSDRMAPAQPPPDGLLVDAGLGLHGHRIPRTVGRRALRQALWTGLVDHVRGVSVLLVTGAPGVGTSHLADELCRAARREDRAEVVAIRMQPGRKAHDAVIETLADELRLPAHAPEDTLRDRIHQHLAMEGPVDPDLVQMLLDAQTRRDGPRAANAALIRLLTRRTEGRGAPAALLWIDAPQEDPEILALIATLRQRRNAPPTVVVVTSPHPAPDHPTLVDAVRFEVDPLSQPQIEAILQQVLPLEATTLKALASAADGHIGHALSALRSRIDTDGMEPSNTGYQTRRGWRPYQVRTASLPERPEVRATLLRAALLAPEVDQRIWSASVDDPDGRSDARAIPLAAELVRHRLTTRLSRRGLVKPTRTGITMDAALAASVLQASEASERKAAVRDVSTALSRLAPLDPRLPRLLLESDRPDDASAAMERLLNDLRDPARRPVEMGVIAREALQTSQALGWSAAHPLRELAEVRILHTLPLGRSRVPAVEATLARGVAHGWRRLQVSALAWLATTDTERIDDRASALRIAAALPPMDPGAHLARISLCRCLFVSNELARAHRLIVDLREEATALGAPFHRTTHEANEAVARLALGLPLDLATIERRARRAEGVNLVSAIVLWDALAALALYDRDLTLASRAANTSLRVAERAAVPSVSAHLVLAWRAAVLDDQEGLRFHLDAQPDAESRLLGNALELIWAIRARSRPGVQRWFAHLQQTWSRPAHAMRDHVIEQLLDPLVADLRALEPDLAEALGRLCAAHEPPVREASGP